MSQLGNYLTEDVNLLLADVDRDFPSMTSENETEIIYDLVIKIFDVTVQRTVKTYHEVGIDATSEEVFDTVLRYGAQVWEQVLRYIWEIYKVNLEPSSYVFSLEVLAKGECTEENEYSIKPLHDAISRYVDNLSCDVADMVFKGEREAERQLTDEELEEYMNEIDSKVLEEFFIIFQTLGTVKKNPADYATDEERKMHEKLMRIYNLLISGK